MRKLWSSSVPGKDRCADIIFHFHQELPKLIRGYHQCTREEAAILAALIYRVKFAESKTDISSVLKCLVPGDLLKIQSSYEWKKEIARAYNKDSGMSPDEAKIAFLKIIYRWPTYGSAFFEAHQNSDPSFPEHLIVAINKQGVNIIHSQTKVILILTCQSWFKTYLSRICWPRSPSVISSTGSLVQTSSISLLVTPHHILNSCSRLLLDTRWTTSSPPTLLMFWLLRINLDLQSRNQDQIILVN